MKNFVFLVGRAGDVPTNISTKTGKSMASFSLATHDVSKNNKGEYIENTQWHDVVGFGGTADRMLKIIQKGDVVCIEGRIEYGEYTNKEGQKVRRTRIIANAVDRINTGKGKVESTTQEPQTRAKQSPSLESSQGDRLAPNKLGNAKMMSRNMTQTLMEEEEEEQQQYLDDDIPF